MSQYSAYWQMRRDAASRRPLLPAVGGASAIALLAATLPSLFGGRASANSVRVAFVGHSPRALKHPATPARRVATASTIESHVILGAPAEPRATSSTMSAPASQSRTTPVTTEPKPSAPKTVSDSPLHRAAVHHQAAPAVAASVARRPAHPSHASTGSGGAAPERIVKHHHVTSHDPSTTHHHSSTHHPAASSNRGSSGGAGIQRGHGTTPTGSSGGYVNPLAHASVTPERIDQGVDYAGSGTLTAIGAGTVTYVATSGTGWPGAFIEYQLLNGPDVDRYVYYAEGITPVSGLHVGERVRAGQAIATLVSGSGTGIEIGWGAGVGTESYAMQHGQWRGNDDARSVPSRAGKDFSALIASLGGPPGKIEG